MSRRTMLVVYDLLHYLTLNGPRIKRDALVDYLHRATTRKPTAPQSRLRAFERFKHHLRALGITHRNECVYAGRAGPEVWFVLPQPDRALCAVSALLSREEE